jgi:hypothetical protein
MTSGGFILNFLNGQNEFWFWGVNKIRIEDKYLEFNASKQGKNTTFHIAVDITGFKVKLLKKESSGDKLIKKYEGISPRNLCEVITNMVFSEKLAA